MEREPPIPESSEATDMPPVQWTVQSLRGLFKQKTRDAIVDPECITDVDRLRSDLIEHYPMLASIPCKKLSPWLHRPPNMGVFWTDPQAETPLYVTIVDGDKRYYNSCIRLIGSAGYVEEMKKGYGIEFSSENPQLLKAFMLLHEYGHALDFLEQEKKLGRFRSSAIYEWHARQDDVMKTLPLHDWPPSRLIRLGKFISWTVIKNHPRLRKQVEKSKIYSIQELIRAQIRAYIQLPYERTANMFAVEQMQRLNVAERLGSTF